MKPKILRLFYAASTMFRSGTGAFKTALSLNDMSYNVVHEEKPGSQVPSIVLQDCGKILPGCK